MATEEENKSIQYQEALLEAIKIVSKKQVESVSFDKTVEAVVTDASKASEGAYIVSTGDAQFTAYSTVTEYKNNDAVMVTIPQGDYDKQKMIVGKQVGKTNSPIIYKSPFQRFINISNNLIYGDNGVTSYYANGLDNWLGKRWDIDSSDFTQSNAYTARNGQIWDSGDIFEQGFTRLGLSAQFSTWLSEYDVISGNYGLALEITFKCVDLLENNTFTKIITFDSSEFFGDVYNFETYYVQEKLFNIEEFIDYPITHITLFAYQRGNFINLDGSDDIYDGENLPQTANEMSIVQPNIFIKDVLICLGIPVEDFETDTAEVMCDGTLAYKKYTDLTDAQRADANKKVVQLRWIHKDTKTDIIATVEESTIPEGYEIRWYRKSTGAPSPDQFAGAHWKRYYGHKSSADATNGEWAITQEEYDANNSIDSATDLLEIDFQPNVNKQEEQLKAIIIKSESQTIQRLVAASSPIIFTNDDDVRSSITLIDANALSIKYEDDEKGHYFLYDESGEIGKNEDSEVRVLTAVFDESRDGELDVYKKPPLNIAECSKVVWTFPDSTMNTMIIPMDSASEDANVLQPDEHGNYTISNAQSVGFTIKKQLNNNATQNRIRLDITKDGQDYSAWVDPIFGTAGDNGSDYKVILSWRNGKNALNLSKDNNNRFIDESVYDDSNNISYTNLIGDVVIFDQAGDVVDWPADAELTVDWYVAEFGSSTVKQKEKEDEDIYYPVFRNNSDALNYNLAHNPDSQDQPAGYYYFVENPTTTGYSYVRFDQDNNVLTSAGVDLTSDNQQLYRKRQSDAEKKNKLEFKKILFATDPLNQETGAINTTPDEYGFAHGNVQPIRVVNTSTNGTPKYEKRHYYSTNKKYFIKVNDQYVLDPWQNYQEVETYYEPIEAEKKIYILDAVGQAQGGLTATENNQVVTITADTSVNMNSLFILQLTLKNFGDYDLVSYYPIALKNGETKNNNGQMTRVIQYIEGPDRVRYGSSGETDFKKNPYQISTLQFNQNSNKFESYYHGYQNDNLSGHWQLLFPSGSMESNFDPILQESYNVDPNDATYVEFDKPLLSPSGVHIPEARPYGVQFIDSNSVCLWTQPILVYQNKYPSRTLNKWNGKDIETDNDAGTITASGFAAGRKDRENKFTGVVIGDWSRSKADTAITKNTGIYGFNSGAMAYAFKDDGTGFIGKDGKGRIYLDGDKSQIFSSHWVNRDNPEGMLLDIDDGYIKMQSKAGDTYTRVYQADAIINYFIVQKWRYAVPSENEKKAFTDAQATSEVEANAIYDSNTTYYKKDTTQWVEKPPAFSISAQAYHLTNNRPALYYTDQTETNHQQVQENDIYSDNLKYFTKTTDINYITLGSNQNRYPLAIGTNKSVTQRGFRVEWDGTTYINNGQFSGEINAKGGTISGNLTVTSRLDVSHGEITGAYITTRYLEANNGSIGGWTIDGNRLYGGQTELSASNGITTNSIKINNASAGNVGTIGYVQGSDDTNSTDLLGIKTASGNNKGIALMTGSNSHIRLGGITGGSSLNGGIYMYTSQFAIRTGPTTTLFETNTSSSHTQLTSSSYYIHCFVPADHQLGIYARFA